MVQQKTNAQATSDKKHTLTPHETHERKQRVLTKGAPSLVRSIADAVVIKNKDLFFLTQPDGGVPLDGKHGYGLYYHDCRFLNGYDLKIANGEPDRLVSTAAVGFEAVFELTNPDIRMENGDLVPKESIGLRWERLIDGDQLTLTDILSFHNYGLETAEFPVDLGFRSQFEPLFAVRGLIDEHPGQLHDPEWQGDELHLAYDGQDGMLRTVAVAFSLKPRARNVGGATFDFQLDPHSGKTLVVQVQIGESQQANEAVAHVMPKEDQSDERNRMATAADDWLGKATTLTSNSLFLNDIVDRSTRDLYILMSTLKERSFFSAGVPWYATLFGRDSLISAMEMLAYQPNIAASTLRLLASYQGTKVDDWRDEQPGKVMHELRLGELADMGKTPYNPPYYGTVDATPLFLVALGQYSTWTGTLDLFRELKPNVERALEWIAKYGDDDGDGFVSYESTSGKGLTNQGWKDSGDAIMNADGSLATPPIALPEVQGYVYMGKTLIAGLYRRDGDEAAASRLEKEAQDLKQHFNRAFWLEDLGTYALALQKDGKPCRVVASNAGQVLWSGIADPDKAKRVIDSLLTEEMFSGWGIRTLSSRERRFNPIGYHLGTVWPHDNAIIAAGAKHYGFDDAAGKVFQGIIDAALNFDYYRLPEVFAGFSRQEYAVPVHYPVACHPQAWAAGSVPYLLSTLVGLSPEAFEGRLRVVRPMLPAYVDRLELHSLRVGTATADLRFTRAEGGVAVEVLRVNGPLEVVVEARVAHSEPSEDNHQG